MRYGLKVYFNTAEERDEAAMELSQAAVTTEYLPVERTLEDVCREDVLDFVI
jgi:hypothetical protein